MNTITPALTIGQTRLLATVIKTTRNMLWMAEDEAWEAVVALEFCAERVLSAALRCLWWSIRGELVA